MSMLGTPSGMVFSDWLANTTGESVLNTNNGENGKKDDWVNERWTNNVREQRDTAQAKLNEKPNWAFYFMLASIVFIIGSILGK